VLRLFLLRHGETEFSRHERFCGSIDAPLTAAGRKMGQLFADSYVSVPWRAIITSTRRRAVATAQPLADRLALPIHQDSRLDEMFFGEWQGLTKKEASARDPAHYSRWRADPTIGPPAGESPVDVSARAFDALEDLRARYDTGNVLVVSHKTVLRLLLCRLLNIDVRRYRDCINWPTGAVSVLDIGPGDTTTCCLADEKHLYPQPARDLVGEQDAGWGELEIDVVDDEPAGADGALDFEITTEHGIDAMAGTMAGAIDPGSGA
jgi:probable phosphoglycerate mutase